MPSRRPHTKTRHGCNTCKARRVRCDEEKPICRNCIRGDRECTYSDQVFVYPDATSLSDTKNHVFPIRDLELLHHYTTHTYCAMGPTEDNESAPLWQIEVPRLAFEYPFLLHGLLALAALHKRSLAEGSQKTVLMDLARYHQQHALTLYIPLLQDIDQHNCHPLFAFSIVLSMICMAVLGGGDAGPQALISGFVDVADTLLGCTAIARQASQWLLDGPLHFILSALGALGMSGSAVDPEAQRAIEILLNAVDDVCGKMTCDDQTQDASERRQAYHAAIRALSAVLAPLPYEQEIGVVVSWPVFAGSAYIALLKSRDPLALAILGHYGVALHLHAQVWMLRGLGERLTRAVADALDSTWSKHLTWAVSRIAQPVTLSLTQPVTPHPLPSEC